MTQITAIALLIGSILLTVGMLLQEGSGVPFADDQVMGAGGDANGTDISTDANSWNT